MSDDPEAMFIRHLRTIAGAADDATAFTFEHRGVGIRAYYSSGSSSYLSISADYPNARNARAAVSPAPPSAYRAPSALRLAAARPLRIVLRREGAAEVQSKLDGVDREFQTGDPAFDDAVYIDAPCADEVLRAVLGAHEARAAVLALLDAGFPEVHIDDDDQHVAVRIGNFPALGREEPRVRKVVDAFAALVRALPAIESAGVRPRPSRAAMGWATFFAFATLLGSCLNMFAVAPDGCVEHTDDGESIPMRWVCVRAWCFGFLAGAAAFVLACIAANAWFRARLSGSSDSSARIRNRAVVAGILAYGVTCIAVAWASR